MVTIQEVSGRVVRVSLSAPLIISRLIAQGGKVIKVESVA
jgi:hypothetical protein